MAPASALTAQIATIPLISNVAVVAGSNWRYG